jgi:signal transduction histidine kinase
VRLPDLFHSTAFRTGLAYAALFGLSAVVLFGIMYWQTAGDMERQLRDVTHADMRALTAVFDDGGLPGLRRAIEERVAGTHGRAGWYLLLDARGNRLAGNLPALTARSGWREVHLPETGTESGEHEHGEGRTVLGEGRRLEAGGFLFVGQDADQLAETRELWTYALLWGIGATLLLAAAGGALMGAAALRRVEAINRVTGAIVQGDLDRRIPRRGSNDEFDVLATHLNEMLARIQQLMEGMRQVSSDIAHDLRTPLGRLRQTLEKTRREATTVAQYQAAVDHAIGQTDQILETFAALLRIAQIESGSRRARFTDVDLSAALETVVDAYAPVAEDSGHTLQASIPPDIHVQGDRELLVQAVANLVENALRHTQATSRIEVALEALPDAVVLTVADNGPGIPEDLLGKVTQRFYRLEASRSTPGSGLGLSLVAAVAALHHVPLQLSDNRPGLRATLRFGRD